MCNNWFEQNKNTRNTITYYIIDARYGRQLTKILRILSASYLKISRSDWNFLRLNISRLQNETSNGERGVHARRVWRNVNLLTRQESCFRNENCICAGKKTKRGEMKWDNEPLVDI